jgi:hypothetical protein
MQEQWRRVFSMRRRHWRRVGSRAAVRNSGQLRDLERFPPLLPSSPAVTCKTQIKARKQLILSFFFSPFWICFFFVCFQLWFVVLPFFGG